MKQKILLLVFGVFMPYFGLSQNNPIQNLTYTQTYVNMQNNFHLNWEEPALPHYNLLGYNIYRNEELYRFQTETSLYYMNDTVMGLMTNCGMDFLLYDNQNQVYTNGFDIHVTAVYESEKGESDYFQTCHSYGALLAINNFTQEKPIIYPNPSSGILHIGNQNIDSIVVYDVMGKLIQTFTPKAQLDLSDLPKGFYVVKLFSGSTTMVDKIILR